MNKNKKTSIIVGAVSIAVAAVTFKTLSDYKKHRKPKYCKNWTDLDFIKEFSIYLNKKYPGRNGFRFISFDSILSEAIYEDRKGTAFKVFGNISNTGRFLGCVDNYALNVFEEKLSDYINTNYYLSDDSEIYVNLQHCYDLYADFPIKKSVREILDKYTFENISITISTPRELFSDEIDDFMVYFYSLISVKKYSIRLCTKNRPLYKTINNY